MEPTKTDNDTSTSTGSGDELTVRSGCFMDLEPDQVNGTRYVRRMVTGVHHTFCIVEAEAGWVTKTHSHENDETVYLLRGSMNVIVDGEEHDLKVGDFVHIPPGIPHRGVVGPEGMTQMKVFSPPREDYIQKTDSYLRDA